MAFGGKQFPSIFSRIEATLSQDWIKQSGRDVTEILKKIEEIGIDEIQFKKGSHVLTCSLDQLENVSRVFSNAPNQKIEKQREAYPALVGSCTRKIFPCEDDRDDGAFRRTENPKNINEIYRRNDRDPFAEGEQIALPGRKEQEPHRSPKMSNCRGNDLSGKTTDSDDTRESDNEAEKSDIKELMVDNDIWDFIERKKSDQLNEAQEMYGAVIKRTEDDSGVTKILIKPKPGRKKPDQVSLMHETLIQLYEDTFKNNIIETTEERMSEEDAQLVMDHVEETFPDVLTKHCIYNDSYLFIGPSNQAHRAKQLFKVVTRRILSGDIQGASRSPRETRWDHDQPWIRQPDILNEPTFERNRPDHQIINRNILRDFGPVSLPVTLPAGNTDSGNIASHPKSKKFRSLRKSDHSTDDSENEGGNQGSDGEEMEKSDISRKDLKLAYEENIAITNYLEKKVVIGDSRREEVDDSHEREVIGDLKLKDHLQISNDSTDEQERLQKDSAANCEVIKAKEGAANAVCTVGGSAKALDSDSTHSDREDQAAPNKTQRKIVIDASGMNMIYNRRGKGSGSSTEEDLAQARKSTSSKRKSDGKPRVRIIRKELPTYDSVSSKNDADHSKKDSGSSKIDRDEKGSGKKYKPEECIFVADQKTKFKPKPKKERLPYDSPSTDDEDSDFLVAKGGHIPDVSTTKRITKAMSREEQIQKLMERNDVDSQKELDALLQEDIGRTANPQPDVVRPVVENMSRDDRIEELFEKSDEESRKLVEQLLLEPKTNDGHHEASESEEIIEVRADFQDEKEEEEEENQQKQPARNFVIQPPDGNFGSVIDSSFHLPGFDQYGCIEMTIRFNAGTQSKDMEDPGREYNALLMKAFLPSSSDGREALMLIKKSFNERKLFRVEKNKVDSVSKDDIVPNEVEFKRELEGDNGYPDEQYPKRVLSQLKDLLDLES